MVRVSASPPRGRGFNPRPRLIKDFKNGTLCLPIYRLTYENGVEE